MNITKQIISYESLYTSNQCNDIKISSLLLYSNWRIAMTNNIYCKITSVKISTKVIYKQVRSQGFFIQYRLLNILQPFVLSAVL